MSETDTIIAPGEDRVVRDSEAGKITGTSRTTRWRLEREGKFPARLQLSPGAVGWLASELQEWIQERRDNRQVEVTAAPQPGALANHP